MLVSEDPTSSRIDVRRRESAGDPPVPSCALTSSTRGRLSTRVWRRFSRWTRRLSAALMSLLMSS